ncbi:MAG: methyltransferase domain-containing protein [Oceanibaculum sp.]
MIRCPVCDGTDLTDFVNRGQVPTHQNLLMPDADTARDVVRGELDMCVCGHCGFVFNRSFDLSRVSYGPNYDNTQACSGYFDGYLDGLVADLVERHGVRDCTIVEVGCGKGHFLRKLVAYPGSGNRGLGFDPTYVGPERDLDGRLSFYRRFYDSQCAEMKADVVVCRHVIEHVPDPMTILHAVHSALAGSPTAKVYFETPCVEWILRNKVVWDFFYEHCSLFTENSLSLAFEQAGFTVRKVDHVFGGQYLWLEADLSKGAAAPSRAQPETMIMAKAYAKAEAGLSQQWRGLVKELRRQGKVALWGAGAKGATLANLIDLDRTLIDCVVDVNPGKQGRFIPGTGHPIVAPHDMPARGVHSAILMNPNYRDENLALLDSAGIDVQLIDWSSI